MLVPLSLEPGLPDVTPLALGDLPAQRAHILAFDTSTESLALAACGPAGAFSLLATGGAAASASLLPQALRVLALLGLRLTDLDAIAFGSGPGAFTGLRTACAVAQGLGLGLGLPLLPLDSLLLVAEDARLQGLLASQGAHSAQDFEVAVAMDARMNEVYAGRYRWQSLGANSGPHAGAWQVLQTPQLCSLPALAQAWADLPLPLVAGSALAAFGSRLPLPPQAQRVAVEHNRGAALLQLALRAWGAGQAVDAALAQPLYVRDKVAQTTLEREQAKAAAVAVAAPVATVAGAPAAPAAPRTQPQASSPQGAP